MSFANFQLYLASIPESEFEEKQEDIEVDDDDEFIRLFGLD